MLTCLAVTSAGLKHAVDSDLLLVVSHYCLAFRACQSGVQQRQDHAFQRQSHFFLCVLNHYSLNYFPVVDTIYTLSNKGVAGVKTKAMFGLKHNDVSALHNY